MERELLEQYLAAGESVERIAERVGRHPSTVSYWMKKYGLANPRSAKHASRGGLSREVLEPLLASGLTLREIAAETDRSVATVRYWLARHGLKTQMAWREEPRPREITRVCKNHGETRHVLREGRTYRCAKCRAEQVANRRRRVKRILVTEAGGKCVNCGYHRYVGALEFHHVDPSTKDFGVSQRGVTLSLAAARREAAKCVLLCANCHAEVEAGLISATLKPLLEAV